MKYLESKAYEVKIYIGSREGYYGDGFEQTKLVEKIREFQKETKRDKLVSLRVSPCLFVVGDWDEAGWEIGAINYPRYPKNNTDLDEFMINLAKHLLTKLKQNRITLTTPTRYITLERDGAEQHRIHEEKSC